MRFLIVFDTAGTWHPMHANAYITNLSSSKIQTYGDPQWLLLRDGLGPLNG